ncbi:MAG: FCD domain-containing protein, partial [Propionicimonas sp.]|nr:FCD domain-containing protein [Propionicimonas sp.]
EWPINSRIPTEAELMELLGVGKTTVREAVRSLASVGMLETLPGRGTFVRSRTPVNALLGDVLAEQGVDDLLVLRRALEVEAAQRAAVHRTDEQLAALQASHEGDLHKELDRPGQVERGRTPGQFHFLILEASQSALLVSLYTVVMAALRKAIASGSVVDGASEELRRADHQTLLEAIADRDPLRAGTAMAEHADRDLVAGTRADAATS